MQIHSQLHTYEVELVENSNDVIQHLNLQGNSVFIIDKKVWHLYKKYFKNITNVILIDSQEQNKSLKYIEKLSNAVLRKSFKRNMSIVSIGGGIVQDISGFLASTLFRGVTWIYFPTTMISQADSCIGSKTSLNLGEIKNVIGTFYPPKKVFIDLNFLTTLSDRDYFGGLGEIIKLNIIGGIENINVLTRQLDGLINRNSRDLYFSIRNSLSIKSNYIQQDEFDHGTRAILNYGHTFGHAIEGISNFDVSHGQAILIGMMIANHLACSRQLLDRDKDEFLRNALFFPVMIKTRFEFREQHLDKLLDIISKDKKQRSNTFYSLILLRNDFSLMKYDDVTTEEIRISLQSVMH